MARVCCAASWLVWKGTRRYRGGLCPARWVRNVCGQAELGSQNMLVPCWALCQFCCWFWVCASCHWKHHTPQAVHNSPAPGEGSDVVFFSCYVFQHFIWRIMSSLSRIFTVDVRQLFSFEREFKQLSSDGTDHSVLSHLRRCQLSTQCSIIHVLLSNINKHLPLYVCILPGARFLLKEGRNCLTKVFSTNLSCLVPCRVRGLWAVPWFRVPWAGPSGDSQRLLCIEQSKVRNVCVSPD